MFSLLSDSRVLKERNPPLERINSLRLADRSADVVSSVADGEEEEGGDVVLGSRYEDGSNLMAGCAYAMPTPPPPDAVDRPPRSYHGIGGDGP